MQGRTHQTPSQTRLQRDLRGFAVTNLTGHVRVLAQDRAQAFGKSHVDLGIDRSMTDAVEIVFDRVFDGQDIAFGIIQHRQHRVQRRGFTGAGGSRYQDDAAWLLDHAFKALVSLNILEWLWKITIYSEISSNIASYKS